MSEVGRTVISAAVANRLVRDMAEALSKSIAKNGDHTMRRIKSRTVMQMLDIKSKETLRKYVKDGRIPKPFRESDSPGAPRYWIEEEIEEFIKGQSKNRG